MASVRLYASARGESQRILVVARGAAEAGRGQSARVLDDRDLVAFAAVLAGGTETG